MKNVRQSNINIHKDAWVEINLEYLDPDTNEKYLTAYVEYMQGVENTNYYYYVRSVCGANDTSLWAGPAMVKTACSPQQIDTVYSFEALDENKINVLVKESTESQTNWLKVKEDNMLAVEEIGLDDAVTTKDIVVEGGQWATAVKTVFTNGVVPAGTSWQSFLESMLCVEKFAGTISTTDDFKVQCAAPGAGITGATHNGSVEVGTKVTLEYVDDEDTEEVIDGRKVIHKKGELNVLLFFILF